MIGHRQLHGEADRDTDVIEHGNGALRYSDRVHRTVVAYRAGFGAFGLIHGYYDYKTIVVIMVEGCLLGLLAHWRKSLRPGMLAHGLEDLIGGLVGFLSR